MILSFGGPNGSKGGVVHTDMISIHVMWVVAESVARLELPQVDLNLDIDEVAGNV